MLQPAARTTDRRFTSKEADVVVAQYYCCVYVFSGYFYRQFLPAEYHGL